MGTVRDLTSAQARPYLDAKFWGYYDAVAGRLDPTLRHRLHHPGRRRAPAASTLPAGTR